MKMEDLNGKQRDELKALVVAKKKELFNLRFQQASGELSNTARFKEVRRDVARIRTALSQLDSKASA